VLKQRVYTVAVLLPVFLLGLFYAPALVWALMLALLVLIAAWEWGSLAGWGKGIRMAYVAAMGAGLVMLWQVSIANPADMQVLGRLVLVVSLLFWLLVVPLWLARGWKVRVPLFMAGAGAVLLLPLWFALVQMHAEPRTLLMLMIIVWVSDTAAYFSGRQWGRRKLAVAISPGKTWEGVWGAVAGVTAYWILARVGGFLEPVILHGIAGFFIFLVLMILGIEGDLFESWIKRVAGVKDSGAVFPGHGGVLDRIDALTAAMPAAALLLKGLG
jgi:phosphatidate cytidylyltransferase